MMIRIAVLGVVTSCVLMTLLAGPTELLVRNAENIVLSVNAPDTPATAPEMPMEAVLPVQIPDTPLIAERLVCYDGPFLEDGSDEPVCGVSALVLHNSGSDTVTAGEVTLCFDREIHRYAFTHILPGMSVLVLEQSRAAFRQEGVTAASGWSETALYDGALFAALEITPVDMGTLRVTNTGDTPITDITLYHRNWLPDDLFVGGTPYRTQLTQLEAGEEILLRPEYYADGYSKIFHAE